MREKAVIYVPNGELQAATICLQYAQMVGYYVEGVVVGKWRDAQKMALDGIVQVLLAAERWHLPPDRVPRIEIPGEMTGTMCRCRHAERPPSSSPMRRRPQSID